MKQRAEKHLEIALGGNMNISTLTPLALVEIMTDFAKKEVEAINYNRCCETLKDKEPISFVDWLKKWNWKQIGDTYVFKKDNSYADAESLLRIYEKEYNL